MSASPSTVPDSALYKVCNKEIICNNFRPFNTLGALQRAKKSVERHYAVVGVLEDLNSTLTVLENYIPLFFRGATQVYWGM